MTVNSISNSGSVQASQGNVLAASEDSYTKNIRQQIAYAQKKMQDLSSDEEMTAEEKMKKRQEIQQEITGLQQQLRQHKIEQRQETKSENSMDEMLGTSSKTARSGKKGTGLSQASMKAILSADASMKQADVQGSMVTQMEGKAGVLKAEIQADKGRGTSTAAKEGELADITARALKTQNAQISTASDAVKTMEEAAKADRTAEADDDTSTKKTDSAKSEQANQTEKTAAADGASGTKAEDTQTAETNNAPPSAATDMPAAEHVDVRL